MLAARAGSARIARRAGADAPEPAAAAPRMTPTTCAPPAPTKSRKADGEAKVSIFASGSEVVIAVEAQKLLAAHGIADARRLGAVLGTVAGTAGGQEGRASSATRRSRSRVEAAIRQGWDAIIGSDGIFVGMSGFGASAPIRSSTGISASRAEAVADAAAGAA